MYDADGQGCIPAPPGSFVAEPGATAPTLCPPGKYQPESGQTGCIDAEAGSFVATAGATAPTLCPAGKYQPGAGQIGCINAEPGSFVSDPGAIAPTLCPAGTYQPGAGQIGCINAEPGTFVSAPGAIAPTPCPAGTYQPNAGQTSCLAQNATTTTRTSSANPARVSELISFRASVTAPAATPDGTVTFLDGTAVLGTASLVNGIATFTTADLAAGTHSITARYDGSACCFSSSSAPVTQVVRPASSTALTVSPSTSVFGQAVTLTANVTSGGATVSGSVTFYDGTTALGTRTLRSGAASLSVTTLPVGAHSLTAVYGGNTGLDGSVSPGVAYSVSQAQTTAVLAVSPGAAVFGQSVTITATVSVLAPGGGTAGGSVSFYDGVALLGTKNLSGGRAVFSTRALVVGSHSLRAEYAGSVSYAVSATAATDLAVSPASTTTTLSSTATSAVTGQKITLTATVRAVAPGTGTPTGSVIFRDNNTDITTVTLSGGRATLQVTLLIGSHNLTAEYLPTGGSFGGSSGAASLTVTQAATTTTLTSSSTPSTFGQRVTFTATLRATAPGAGVPTGTVTFRDGDTLLAEVSVVNGRATFSTTSLARGTHTITASYSGDAGFAGSISTLLAQQVN